MSLETDHKKALCEIQRMLGNLPNMHFSLNVIGVSAALLRYNKIVNKVLAICMDELGEDSYRCYEDKK